MSDVFEKSVAHHFTEITAADWIKVREGLTRRFSGDFPYVRNNTVLNWRTERERAAISIFALDPRIDGIEVMPERVTLVVEGRRKTWSPALRITAGRNVAMTDIIRDASAMLPARQELTDLLTRVYRKRGIAYTTLLESQVRKEPRLHNARLVLGYRGVEIGASTEMAVVAALSTTLKVSLGELETKLAGHAEVRASVFKLATLGLVHVDLWASSLEAMGVKLVSWGGLH